MLAILPRVAYAGSWLVEYDLGESIYQIRDTPFGGAGDGNFPVAFGSMLIAYPEENGVIVDGPARMLAFALELEFQSGNALALVDTDLDVSAEHTEERPDTEGTLAGLEFTWTEDTPYGVGGFVTCNGAACILAGFENGVPTPIDLLDDVRFNTLTFDEGGPAAGAGFSAPRFEVPNEDNATTYVRLFGTEANRTLIHSGDQDRDESFSLSELLRMIQLFASDEISCDGAGEDGYAIGAGDQSCPHHSSDYAPQDWQISFSEVLRFLQLFNLNAYTGCPDDVESEDLYCIPADKD